MSKERLEQLLNDLPYSIRYSGELEPFEDYARELVERVQELGGKLDRIRFVNNDYDRQNKRYREAIKEALEEEEQNLEGYESSVYKILLEALEESE